MITYEGSGYSIYKHTNRITKKVYIGQTKCKDLTRRWAGGHGYKDCKFFFSAIIKYGWINFDHEILETGLTREEAAEREIYYISKYRSRNPRYGYNIKSGGSSAPELSAQGYKNAVKNFQGFTGCPVVVFDTTGKRVRSYSNMSDAAKFLGCGLPAVSRACTNARGTCRGYIVRYAEEVDGVTQLPDDEIFKPREQRYQWKKVSCYTLDGDYVATYDSVVAAKAAIGAKNTSVISSCISGHGLSAHGFQWKTFDGDPPPSISPYHREYRKPKNAIPVTQYDRFSGERITDFQTLTEASVACNCNIESIRACVLGHSKTAAGYIWRKASDNAQNVTPVPTRGRRLNREPA